MKDFYELKCYAIQVEDKFNNKEVVISDHPHIAVDKFIEWHNYKLKAGTVQIMGFDCDPCELSFSDGVLRWEGPKQVKTITITSNDATVLFDAYLSFVDATVRISDKALLERAIA